MQNAKCKRTAADCSDSPRKSRVVFLHFAFCILTFFCLSGCTRPATPTPTLTGIGMFHDITTIKKGMGANEVLRIMGSKYTPVYEEGLQGMDMGVYAWDYAEGRVYFDFNGVIRVVPAK